MQFGNLDLYCVSKSLASSRVDQTSLSEVHKTKFSANRIRICMWIEVCNPSVQEHIGPNFYTEVLKTRKRVKGTLPNSFPASTKVLFVAETIKLKLLVRTFITLCDSNLLTNNWNKTNCQKFESQQVLASRLRAACHLLKTFST